MKDINELYKKIDQDSGLKSKRKMLNITALVFLAIQFTGARLIETNTFIFKLSFEHQEGIALLLALAIFFLLIRYYNYAKPYHNEIYDVWSKNLLKDKDIEYVCPYSDEVSGFLHENYPDGFDINSYLYEEPGSNFTFSITYECNLFLVRYFCFSWSSEYQQEVLSSRVNIFKALGCRKYFLVLAKEAKYQFSRYITHRENLDILAPYFIGAISILIYIFHNQFISILSYIL